MRCIFVLLYLFLTKSFLSAQDIEVKKFEPLEKDQTAVTSPRKDINGNACGLVKVALKEAGAEFEGNVMGDVQFTGNEYLVYLPNGTKRLGIKHPDYLPTTIVFADYGTKRVSSGTTYQLNVKTNKKKAKIDNSKKGMAVFNIKPSNAMLLIDGQIADGSGGAYTLSLPYGTHYYTVRLKDFSLNNQAVHVDKNAKTINVDLTEFFAKLSVHCEITDASVLIDDELMGYGSWEGSLVPGKHEVVVKKEGFHTQSKTIVIEENGEFNLQFDKMKALIGGVVINYLPTGSDVYLDNVRIGTTPMVKNDVSIGKHQLKIKNKTGAEKVMDVIVFEDQLLEINGKLPMTDIEALMEQVSEENGCAMNILGQYYAFDHEYQINFDGPCDKCAEEIDKDVSNDESARLLWKDVQNKSNEECMLEAINWFEKALTARYHSGHELGKYYAMLALSECYARLGRYADSYKWAKKCYDEYNGEGWLTSYYLAWHYYNGKGITGDKSMAKKIIDRVAGGCKPDVILNLINRMSEQLKSPNDLTNYWHFSLTLKQSFDN